MRSLLKWLAAAVVGGSALLSALPALAVGRFVYVEGSVTVRDAAGATRAGRAGEAVAVKETVAVGSGRAQLRFDDGGWIALQSNTVFEISSHPAAGSAQGNVVLSLVKGGLRAVTGLIGRQPERYELNTPTATIGIRGTSFHVTYCQQSCDLPDGLYVTGGDGTIFVKNGFGEIDLTQGRTAYVANAQTPPRESNVKPVAEISQPVSAQQMAQAGSTNPAELRPGNYIYFESASGYLGPLATTSVKSGGIAVAGSGSIFAEASGIIDGIFQSFSKSGSGALTGAAAGTIPAGSTLTITADAAQRPVNITATDNGQTVSITSLQVPQLASGDGILYWGRWTGGKFQVDVSDAGGTATGSGTLGSSTNIHYVVGTPVMSVPLAGTASYGFIGSTGSSSFSGTVGAGVTAGTLTANFATNQVNAALSINHGGVYTANGLATLTAGSRANFSSVSGSATGPTGTHNFSFDGFFAGTPAPVAPSRAGIGWTINRPDAIVGGAAFSCKTGC